VARSRAIDLAAINERFRTETPQLREQWKVTGHELAENRIQVLDDHAAGWRSTHRHFIRRAF
jgi:hypothetical protein